MTGDEVRIGTRGSALALAQANLVADALARAGHANRLVIIETDGDRRAPDTAWGEGAFVAAIERALLDERVDVAVHSAKDIPTDEDRRLAIAAYLPRADPRDALVLRTGDRTGGLDALPMGVRVGTDSPRRTGFLLARRPDLAVHPLHGNVDTRLRRLDARETDALVLACAGLDRLGLGSRISERLDSNLVPPAPGQGAIAVQMRFDDPRRATIGSAIDDATTRLAVESERAFLHASGGGCRAPIGALATIVSDEIELLGGYANPDGTQALVKRRRGARWSGADLGRELADELELGGGGQRKQAAPRGQGPAAASRPTAPSTGRRVLVTRAATQAGDLGSALREFGLEPVLVPSIAVEIEPPGSDLDDALADVDRFDWIVVTSPNGASAVADAADRLSISLARSRIAAVGPATATAVASAGLAVAFQPSRALAATLAAELPIRDGDEVLVVRGDQASDTPAATLRGRGARVRGVVAYRTLEAPRGSGALLRDALANGPVDAVVFTSGSTVRGLVRLARDLDVEIVSIPAVCVGPETADAARRAGFGTVVVASAPDATALAEAAARTVGRDLVEAR